MLSERQQTIFQDVVQRYIHDAHPVGSQMLLDDAKLDVSPATVRNDMGDLEDRGYLFQPHTSAGRIPTEKGWRYYLDTFLKDKEVAKTTQDELVKVVKAYRHSKHELLKHLAQSLADLTAHAVFVAFSPNDTYYTGISKLFSQPEFDEVDMIRAISEVVDHLDDVMPEFFSQLTDDSTVLLGRDNPFNRACGLVLSPIPQRSGLFGVLGPIRQDYATNISLVNFTRNLLADA